ncbi:helicase [Bifidobacterium ramosum]|uniref:Helicase n=1 Tax=Bifidobacterium ramosum TaxID=1798158 RepID=A0A6L4WX14_9BIFI|nr:helicase [Bifidobacterium ramosum]KAB8286736.1 helicase [Bifidobacterium ramosum]
MSDTSDTNVQPEQAQPAAQAAPADTARPSADSPATTPEPQAAQTVQPVAQPAPHAPTDQLDDIRVWRERYRATLAPSPLEDINQLASKLDMTHAHPSGVAQLFASGHAPLDALFRDNGMLRAAGRRIERVLDDKAAKMRLSGVAELSLAVGVASWDGNQMPVLLYPVEVTQDGDVDKRTTVRFTGRVELNIAFVAAMREQGIRLTAEELFDGSNYANGTPDTSAVFALITDRARPAFPGFDIERQLILGCFVDPSSLMLAESQRIIDRLAAGSSGNQLLDALAGRRDAIDALKGAPMPDFSPFDADPHTEYEVGDVDNAVRYAANMAASGRSLFVDSEVGKDTADQAAAIASRCVMNGRTVLYVPCVAEQKRRFTQTIRANEMSGQLLDIAGDQVAANIDRQLIAAVGFRPGVATSRFDQLADELVGVRSRLTRYLGDLHGLNEKWGVSAYQTIQNLASIASLPTHPATHVRLVPQTAHAIGGHLDEWAGKLRRAGELGEFTIGPEDTVWYHASLGTEEEAVNAYQHVVDLLNKLLPATREQVKSTAQVCGFPVPNNAHEWGRQVTVLKNLRRVLDVFQPEIFERDIDAMIEASKPKADRKAEGTSMGFWERRRHIKEAKSLLRVGAQVENLHEALKVVAKQAAQWRLFVPHGGWPVLPPRLDDIIETQDALAAGMTALNTVLATTPAGGNLDTDDLNYVEERLKALYDDRHALDTLPERCCLEQEFRTIGLVELVDDLHNRRVDVDAVAGELQLAWWTTVFEDIVHSSAIISNQDGSVMQTAADRFAQVDVEHVRSIGPMVAQESMRRLSDLLFSRTQEANQLHTVLAGSAHATFARVHRDNPQIIAAAKPILMATPATLAALTDASPLADVAIIDAGAHMPAIELLTILARARQVVVLAHRRTVTSPSLGRLIDMLPGVEVTSHPVRRSPRLTAFLETHGYGTVRHDVAVTQGAVRFHRVDGSGVPVMSSGLVESSQQEIEQVVALITERAAGFTIVPASYVLTVVSLTETFRARLGAELKALASRNKAMGRFLRHVRIVNIGEVAGVQATDVIVSVCYAKTTHGRLLQQFGPLERDGGQNLLLDALAVADRNVDITASFSADDMDDERIHQAGPRMLKTVLRWAEELDGGAAGDAGIAGAGDVDVAAAGDGSDDAAGITVPGASGANNNVLFVDLADRLRARGLNVAVDYGFDRGPRIPLVVGLKDKPFALAVLTDDVQFMGTQSTRERHRLIMQNLATLGWSVMSVWSVAAFVNPDKEVDHIIARIGELYQEAR